MGHSLARHSLRQVPMKLPLVSGNNNRIGLQSGSLGATSGLFSTFGRNFFDNRFLCLSGFPHDLSPE